MGESDNAVADSIPAFANGPGHSAGPAPRQRPPRIDPSLREASARTLPGWTGLLALLIGVGAVFAVTARTGALPHVTGLPDIRSAAARESGRPAVTVVAIVAVSTAGVLTLVALAGLLANDGGQARVLTRWGRYRGTLRRTGLFWVNPLLRRRRVDIRLRHWRSEPVSVTDCAGTPIVVRLLVIWRVKDTARAVLGIADHESYLREQVHAVLDRTAGRLPCDSDAAPGPALRDTHWFADQLTRALLPEVVPTGIEVYSVQPLTLDYAPELVDPMRRRRRAELDAGIRTVHVDQAVETAVLAVRRLERATARELGDVDRSALMEQLLVALVAPAGIPAHVPSVATRPGRKEGKPA